VSACWSRPFRWVLLRAFVAVAMVISVAADQGASLAGQPSCVVRDLGTLGGTHGNAVAASANGLVVGIADDGAGVSHPVLWRDGHAERIDTGLDQSVPRGVNARGVVIGVGVDRATGGLVGWYWSKGTTRRLAGLGDRSAMPAAIADDGRVVGALFEDDNLEDQHRTPGRDEAEVAALWSTPTSAPQALPPLPGDDSAHAYAIDRRGLVGGVSEGADFTAVVWDTAGVPQALPSLGGTWAIVRGFSNVGDRVGDATLADGADHAVAWVPAGQPRDLGVVGGGRDSVAVGVLDKGAIVGQAARQHGSTRTQAVVWSGTNGGEVLPSLTRGGASDPVAAVSGAAGGRAVGYSEDSVGNRRPVEWQCTG
jgi:uncharacterized membrane protein